MEENISKINISTVEVKFSMRTKWFTCFTLHNVQGKKAYRGDRARSYVCMFKRSKSDNAASRYGSCRVNGSFRQALRLSQHEAQIKLYLDYEK
jgi:hypothetical protein